MTTETRRVRRIPFKPRAVLAALGLALALFPSAAEAATYFNVTAVSTAPASVDATAANVPVIYVDLTAPFDPSSLGSEVKLNLFGDVPANLLSVTLWRDEGADGFSVANDTPVASAPFNPPNAGFPARATLITNTDPPLSAGPLRYYFTVSFNGVPVGRKLSFGFQMSTDFSNTPNNLPLPFISNQTVVRAKVFAKPSEGNYPTPTGGATRSGGLDTGLFVQAGQRVRSLAAPGILWNVSSSTNADGIPASEGVAFSSRGLLIGRIGAGQWIPLGQSSTITATSNGILFVAANDGNYADNSGFVSVTFDILPSTTPKVWVGGTLGFETAADIVQNWLGGRPFNGESVLIGPGSTPIDWNLPNVFLSNLTVSTAYTGAFRLVTPPYHFNNRLTVDGNATISGGQFIIGSSSGTEYNTFVVKGRLVVKDTATLDASGAYLELGLGAEIRGAALLRAAQTFNIRRAIPSLPWYLRVDQGTVNVTASTTLEGVDYLDFINASVLAFDNATFTPIDSSTSPFARFAAGGPVNYTFNNWSAGPSGRSPAVHAAALPSGSAVVFNNSTAIGSTNFGSPTTLDPNAVVRWIPDGGGGGGSIGGTIVSPTNGTYRVIASTSPKGGDNTGLGGGGGDFATVSGSGGYSMTGLRTPSTYYLFAYINDGQNVGAHSPRGGFGHDGLFLSEPVYLSNGASQANIDINAANWGAVGGFVSNGSNQTGPMIVETWAGTPNIAASTRVARGVASPQTGYVFQTMVDASAQLFAFIDANRNNAWDSAFEASGAGSGAVSAASTITINVNITGGSAAPGGTVALSTQAVHPGAVGRTGSHPLIRSRLTSSGSPSELSALTVRFLGGPPLPDPGAHFSAWSDTGDGVFNPAQDALRGSASIITLGPSTYTITFSTPLVLPVGVPQDVFLTLNLANWSSPDGAGAMIDAATSYTLSAGSFGGTPSFPSSTGLLPVLTVVSASATATSDLQGGTATQNHFFPGQMVSVASFGSWKTGPGDAPTGPGGAPGTTGLNTVLPSANRGELIGRVQAPSFPSSPWVRVGASSAPFASPGDGQLYLAINDFVGAYPDNSGTMFAGFSVSGSSLGALAGTVYYSTPVAGTLTVVARKDGTTPMGQTSFGIGTSSSASPFVISGLIPGNYEITATNSANSDSGISGQGVQVQAGATTYLDAVMYQGVGSIAGGISYSGVLGQGAFHVRVATVTDFTGQVHFFGGYSNANSGAYSITSLPAPNTYYLVAYRDGDNNDRPNGTEPLGYYGAPGGSLSTLPSFLTPVYVEVGENETGISATLSDSGAIEGSAVLLGSATGALVLETGRGVPGSAGYVNENRTVIPIAAAGPPPGGVPYNLGLLRPATGYSLFAFVDKNQDGQPSGGEEQFAAGNIAVPSGGRARFDFSLSALSAPPVPGLTASAGASAVAFNWNLVPGATGYQLRDAGDLAILHLSGSTSYYADSLSPNTASAIRGITASNGNGVSAIHRSSATYTLAATPGTPVVSGMSALGATISWGSSNPAGTLYELYRATDPVGVITRVFTGTATAVFNPLAPASTYFWAVLAENGNGVKSDFSALVSTVTEPLAGPSLAGTLSYSGFQTAGGRGFVIEASTSSTTFFPRASSAALPGAPFQPWFLQVPAGTYFTRAFVDLAGNGVLQPIADRGQTAGSSVVAGSPVSGVNFTVVRDTVAPGAPAGVLAIPGNNKVTLTWAAPTKNANNTNLIDLAGYEIERSTVNPPIFSTLAAVSSASLTFVDNFPAPGIPNLYRLRAFDVGANRSSPSGAVSGSPSSGGSISGQIRDILPGTGEYRVRLSTLPSSSAASVAERGVSSFTFTGLADGVYYLRAFRDANFNGVQDPLTDPAGTFGGLNLPFPIAIVNGNAVSGADATICPRSPLTPPAVAGSLTLGGCPALDKGPGFVTSLYALSVGQGVQGSLGLGTQVNIAVSTATAFATDLILLGPDGRIAARDNRVGGANLTTTLSTAGIYLAELTSFQSGVTGSFQLNMRLEGGFAGVIAGAVNYSGASTGKVYAQLYNQPSQTAVPILTSTATSAFPTPTAFSFAGLPDGAYYLRSFLDTNDNGVRDNGEPLGQHGLSVSSAAAISVVGGLASGSPFAVTIADPAVGVIRGSVLYDGTASGSLRVEAGRPACSGCSSVGEVVASTVVVPGGVYNLLFIPSATDYVVSAYIDGNGNGRSDALEPTISSFPINVFVNGTSTVSLIVADAGGGAEGYAIVAGTVTYLGSSAGPVVMGLSRDSQFRSVDYLITLSTTGYFERAGLQGDATYYMAGFIDNNFSNGPDADQGEPVAAGAPYGFSGDLEFENPPEIFVANNGVTLVQLALADPPNGSMQGVVKYAGASAAGTLVVSAYPSDATGFVRPATQVIARTVGVSTYAYSLSYLSAQSYFVNAFIDANGNGYTDFGEPSGGRPPVPVSSGTGSYPTYGADVEIRDPGSLGASQNAGTIRGEITYLGTQSGPMFVRFFGNPDFLGAPLYTLRVPLTGDPPAGPGDFSFTRSNLPFGTYYLDAFRDPSGAGVYNPAAHAHGYLETGLGVELSAERNEAYAFGSQISDPGMAGSVNAFAGSFDSPAGVRFDGGATDLGVLVMIDSTPANGPQPIVLGITAQNEGVQGLAVRFSSAGVMISSRIFSDENFSVNSFALDPSGNIYVPGREEGQTFNGFSSTGSLTRYDPNFGELNYAEFPDHQGFDGVSYAAGSLYAASRILSGGLRAIKFNPTTLAVVSSGTFYGPPSSCLYCQSRLQAAALSPDGNTYIIYAIVNQESDSDRGLHFLVKFDASMNIVASLDITALNGPVRGTGVSLAVSDLGEVYLAFPTDANTARTFKFNASGSTIFQTNSTAYGPILVHFSGLGNLRLDPASGHAYEVWESTVNGGDYLLLRYDSNLNLVGQTSFDGHDNSLEDIGFSVGVYNSSMVFVTGSVNNGRNLDWATVRLNSNASGAVSASGAAVAITTSNAVNYISGTVTYGGSLVTSGTVRMALIPTNSYVPIRFATGTFGGSTPFLFNNVPDGQYDVRAFIDNNGSRSPEEGEPIGASTLYGIDHAAESGSQELEDEVQLCDRRQIGFDSDILHSLTAADCTSPDRPGAARRLYTFRGTRGQPVTITMKAIGFYDSYLDLYDPNGDWAEYDDDSGGDGDALINNFILPQDGVYTIDAGAYAGESYGQFKLSLSGSAGALGGINGRVNYTGSQGGSVIVGLFDSPAFSSATSVGRAVLTTTRAFAFGDLPVGTTFYLGAFIDVNANNAPDQGEDGGVFGLEGSPTPVLLASGQVASGLEIAVHPSTAGAATISYVTGVSTYTGTRTGSLVLEFWSSSSFSGRPIASRVVPSGVGAYDVAVPGGVPYFVRGYVDANNDFALQPDEPRGVYAPNNQGAEPVFVPVAQTLVGIDLTLKDPGVGAGGGVAGAGTAVLSSTFVVSGAQTTLAVTYTAAVSSIGAGGQIGFTAPAGFPFPIFEAGVTSVTATSTGPALSGVTYSGPSAFVTVTGAGGLAPGQTVRFVWSNFPAPCAVANATFTVSAAQNAATPPQPLFVGSPALAVVAGPARQVSLDEPYFSVKAGERSSARRLETRDQCGTRVPVSSALTVDLRTRRFDGSSWVADPEVGVTTNTALSTDTVVAVDFAVGQSSRTFFVLSASTGFKNLELHYNLGFPTTYYFGLNSLPADALTAVTVSTAASGAVALSSASIGLAANGQPNQLFVNFRLGDPQQSWRVLVSSLPFKAGETPVAVWERGGFGQPNPGEVAWDGRYLPWINGGARVPNGLYYGRVEVGSGSGVKDDSLRLTVALPQFAGTAYDPGTVPNPPLSGVRLSVYGPAGYFTAETAADGSYVLPGLGAGAYRLNTSRADYVDGSIDLTLNASGAATSFVSRTTGLLVSSNATGGLDLFVGRAPRLTVVPSLDPSVAAVADSQWGSLQVRPSTTSQSASTFYGPMRLKGGTTTFDDGGQWDSASQSFIEKTLLGFNVPIGTYTVLADLNGYSRSTGSVFVGPDGARLDLTPFLPKAVVTGTVNLDAAAPAGGLPVGISAIPLSTTVVSQSLSAGAFINAGSTWAFYSISGFEDGAYLLRANTQGLSAVTTGPIVIAGTAAVNSVNFSTFGAGGSISGAIAVVAPNGTRVFVNAWSPGSFNFGSAVVLVNANVANYSLTGLDAGVPYQLYASVESDTSYDVDGGFPRSVTPPATDSFTLKTASGVISGTIVLRAGATDFTNVILSGVTIASLKPSEVGQPFVEVSTSLPNFLCGDGSSGATGYCPAGVSSATFRVQGVNTETLDLRFLHSTTGQSSRHTVSAVNGATVTLVSDLSASTYSISGFLINQITDAQFNTNEKIVANAPYIPPTGYPAGLSSTTARVTAVRQDIDNFGVAISTVFDPVTARVGFLNDSGAFTIPNVANGVYVVRTTDLRSCATCAVVVPAVGRLVTVSGAAVSSVTLTVSNGFSVSGTISLDGGVQDARVFQINVLNKRQEIVRSTVAYLGDLNLGAMANSVAYSFTNLPSGEFYTLTVRGQLFPIKYAGRPIKFPDAALSPNGLQSNLTNQNVLMQRAAYIVGRLKDGKTGELITAANATLLAPNFGVSATANPWTEGGFVTAASSISARPIEGDGYFRVGPLVPDLAYDLRLAQTTWDPNFLASGSQNYAPVTIGGLKPTPGEIRDVGIVALGQGQSLTGVVRSTGTLLPLGNIKVTARPSFGEDASLVVQTFTNSQGVYSLWVSSAVSNQFTLVAAPRDGNQASDGRYYGTVELSNINLQTQTTANFLLQPLAVVVTGQVLVADAATGGALSYPFGDKRGFPAAAINLQPVGVVSEDPLGDISATTGEGGRFSVPGLSTGVYRLNATSLGYSVFTATVTVIGSSFSISTGANTQTGGILTLVRGATATGRILKSDGTSPNSSEVVGVAAANFGAGEFVVGSVETDPVAKTVNAYTISGFKPGISYNIVLLSGSNGKEVSFPTEGAGVVFTASESTTTKTINLTYRPAKLDCLGTAKALNAARTSFLVQVDCLKPLRQATAADDDLTTILTVSTFTAAGAALVAPNGAGVLSNPSVATTRRLLTATYTLAALETRFSIRIRASAAEIDPNTGDSFAIDKVFDFYAGLESSADGRATNISGGKVGMKPSAQDELLGLDERSGIDLPPGAFTEGNDTVANPTTTVNISMAKGRDQAQAKALSIATLGYAPAALEVSDTPSAVPAEMWAAMSTYRAMASTTQVGGANPISAFYSIFLPAGVRHQLKQRADLTLSYSLAASTSTADDKIQIWFYNAVLGRFVPETVNRRLDTVNKTITVSVDHFSTFVVLDSTPVATSTTSFGGTDLAVANFPNPADCIAHSNIARNSTLFGSGGVHASFVGTMLRASVPPNSEPRELKYNIYTVTGEKVRTIEQGVQLAGQTYYTPWNCKNDAGATVASGVYIGEAIFGGLRKFFKIAIIKGSGL